MNSFSIILQITFFVLLSSLLFSKQLQSPENKTVPNIIFKDNVAYKEGEENPYTGKISIFFDKGIIKSEGLYRVGIKSGLWKEFFLSGQIKSKGIYRNDMKTGVWADW